MEDFVCLLLPVEAGAAKHNRAGQFPGCFELPGPVLWMRPWCSKNASSQTQDGPENP